MKKLLSLFYGLVAYLAFFGTILYAIGFVGNLVVAKTIDSVPELPVWNAVFIDAFLLLMFAMQHSIMARPAFKEWWITIVPAHLERSTFVLLAVLISNDPEAHNLTDVIGAACRAEYVRLTKIEQRTIWRAHERPKYSVRRF